jgi:hypothetical protein
MLHKAAGDARAGEASGSAASGLAQADKAAIHSSIPFDEAPAEIPGASSGGSGGAAVIHQGHEGAAKEGVENGKSSVEGSSNVEGTAGRGGGGRGGGSVEKGGQVANSASQKQALEETSEEPGGGARSVVPRAVGWEGLTSIPNSDFGCSMLLSSEQAVAAYMHSKFAVDENLGDTPQREQSKKVHEASARSFIRSPTRLF